MTKFVSDDRKTINLPVELGTTLYVTESKCGDFCLFQKELFDKIFPKTSNGRCSSDMPCHTKKFRIAEIVFSLSNIDWVLNNWEIKCFTSKKKAEEVLQNRIKDNIEKMKELGFEVQENGYSATRKEDINV